MNKTAIKNFAVWARRKLISDVTNRAAMLGVTETGIAQPLPQSTRDLQFFDVGTRDYVEISGAQIEQRNALLSVLRSKEKTSDYKTAFRSVVEETAYTWFNRLIAVRFMEVNDYLPSRVRVLSSENPGKLEPDLVTNPFETDLDFTPEERDEILLMKDQNRLDELFRMLFIKQCNALGEQLSELFEQIADYTELLLTISFTDQDGVVYHLTHDISEDDFNVEKEGQVEIIGWLYQYYNTEPKDEVFALLKKNVKITKERIPAATQIFTPDWIVRYMVENSLGRLWVEGHTNEDLQSGWKYYLEEAEQEPEVRSQLAEIRQEYAKLQPEDIKFIDPCMGSGHILVYAFDVLMQIYTANGYMERDAAKNILENNLYGIDIDTRAYQLAYFAVMMKARQYNRRILREGVRPNLLAVKDPAPHSAASLKLLGDLEPLGRRLVEDFKDAEEYGSILQPKYTKEELDALDARLAELRQREYDDFLVQQEANECASVMTPLSRQARIMAQKYDVVATNPPYMGSGGMSAKLSEYVKKYYPDSKADLFAVFIERCGQMTRKNGYQAMITQHAWMFLSSYEKLRTKLLVVDIISLAHLGARAFEEIAGEVVQTASFVLCRRHLRDYAGTYCRLIEPTTQKGKEDMFLSAENRFSAQQEKFRLIPGSPISYWVSEKLFDDFTTGTQLREIATPKQGVATTDNNRFVRLWQEVSFDGIGFGFSSPAEAAESLNKWFPFNKGGEFNKWYGNRSHVVNYQYDGKEIKENVLKKYPYLKTPDFVVKNSSYYFGECISWSKIALSNVCFRFYESGFIFSDAGMALFIEKTKQHPVFGLLNSKVAFEILQIIAPSTNFESGHMERIPVLNGVFENNDISINVQKAIQISKQDWDSFETSWDFKWHPMIPKCFEGPDYAYRVEDFYHFWEEQCEERFQKLKAKEEELNRIFIEIYGLQDELTPEVEDKDVTVRRADLQRDIKSLISFAIGCMFGRYSLSKQGLCYAGGEWDDSCYGGAFLPDADNCIPITDEAYFEDDIVGRFADFLRVVYGEATLEENMQFVADALGGGGKTPRDTIRQYFLKDFFKDHCQTYSVTGSGKRPIYWLFDSGKQNGFKALVYMHRWNADTVGNLRVEYLHRMQNIYEREIESCQDTIDNGLNNREIAAATKRKEKLIKQQKECRDYDVKVAHIALSRIDIDLDDGVKVNYRKVQTAADGTFCEILADSKAIMAKEK